MIPPVLAPIKAKLIRELSDASGWQVEPTWDGFRALIYRQGDEVEIFSNPASRWRDTFRGSGR